MYFFKKIHLTFLGLGKGGSTDSNRGWHQGLADFVRPVSSAFDIVQATAEIRCYILYKEKTVERAYL